MNYADINVMKQGKSDDHAWQFLAECPLSEFLSEHDKRDELTAGLLFQRMQELDIPLEYLENIEKTLTGFAKEALVHFKQGGLEFPGHIRVFFNKKMLDETNPPKTAGAVPVEQTMVHAPIKYPSSMKMNGGWGYFIIERSENDADSPERTRPFVDLYLYNEGD